MPTAIGSYATAAALKELIGTTDSDDDNLVATICDRINAYVESQTRQPIVPLASATYTYDVLTPRLRHLWLVMPNDADTQGIGGAREVTLVEIASQTGGDYTTVDAGDYFLRARHGTQGPYRYLLLSDHPVGTFRTFPKGINTVRVTMTAGWDAIPDDLTEAALIAAHRSWNARQIGNQDIAGVDENAKFFTGRERATLRKYMAKPLP